MRKDLQQHLIVGAAIAVGVFAVAYQWLPAVPAISIGLIASVVAGWAKEYIWDKSGRGVVDAKDFHYTCIGGVIGSAAVIAWKLL